MILTQREYAASLEQRRRLMQARSEYLARPQADPRLQEALLISVDTMLRPLEAEIAEFEALRAGRIATFTAASLDALPAVLVQARIAAGLTQRELAARLGGAESAVQRDEAGGYARATLARLARVAEALGVRLAISGHFATPGPQLDPDAAVSSTD
jgi:hypothetical protein